jgi:hypothetical protein
MNVSSLVACVLLSSCFLAAQAAPLQPDGLLLDLPMPPGAGDRFQSADFSFWLADPAQPVRGVIIHQHGCTNASPDKHPPVTLDAHWRALARKHQCALLAPQYQVAGRCDEWNDPESGSERALMMALEDFAQRTGRPELVKAPWVLWGHSGGSSWSAQMIVRHPGRVLAASFRGGCHKQFGVPEFRARFGPVAREIPLLFVWGKRETVPTSSHYVSWEPMNAMYRELRSQGGHVARVLDPRSEHGCDDSRLLIIPFFDRVLSARLANEPLSGTLVDLASLKLQESTSENLRDPALAWLPSPVIASLWQEFSKTGTLKPVQPRLTAPKLKAERNADGHILLTWQVEPSLVGGLRALRIHRDGQVWKQLGVLKDDASVATARDAPPEGLRSSSLVDETATPGDKPVYTLTYLDAAGNESPASPSASVPE